MECNHLQNSCSSMGFLVGVQVSSTALKRSLVNVEFTRLFALYKYSNRYCKFNLLRRIFVLYLKYEQLEKGRSKPDTFRNVMQSIKQRLQSSKTLKPLFLLFEMQLEHQYKSYILNTPNRYIGTF